MQKHETPDSIRLGILLIKEQTTNKKIESRGNTMNINLLFEQSGMFKHVLREMRYNAKDLYYGGNYEICCLQS